MDDKKKIDDTLNDFLQNQNEECKGDNCVIKTDKSLVEIMKKKIVTDDGRQLLI